MNATPAEDAFNGFDTSIISASATTSYITIRVNDWISSISTGDWEWAVEDTEDE